MRRLASTAALAASLALASTPLATLAPAYAAPAPAQSAATAAGLHAAATIKFGNRFRYPDGLIVSISRPRLFKPSDTAVKGNEPHAVRFTVKVINKSTKNYNAPNSTSNAQSGGAEAGAIFDTEQGIVAPPSTPILPDREVTWQIAYGVQDPADIALEFTPDFNTHDTVFFTT